MLATAMAPGVHPARADEQYKRQQKTVKSQNNMELKHTLKVRFKRPFKSHRTVCRSQERGERGRVPSRQSTRVVSLDFVLVLGTT